MADPDLTAPEAVERYNPIAVSPHDAAPYGAMETDPAGDFVLYEQFAALSGALEKEKLRFDAMLRYGNEQEARAEVLDAKLKEAVDLIDASPIKRRSLLWNRKRRTFIASLEGDKP